MTTYMHSGLTQRTLQGALTLRFALALITSVLVTAAVSVPMAVVALRAQGTETGAADYEAPPFEPPSGDDEQEPRETRIIQPPVVEAVEDGVAASQLGTSSGTTTSVPLGLKSDQTPETGDDEEVALPKPDATLKRNDNDDADNDSGNDDDNSNDGDGDGTGLVDTAGDDPTSGSQTDPSTPDPVIATTKTPTPPTPTGIAPQPASTTGEMAAPAAANPVTTTTSLPAALAPVGVGTSGTLVPGNSQDDTQIAAPAPASGTSGGGGQVGTLSAPTSPTVNDGFVTVDNLDPANLPPVIDITDTDPASPQQSSVTATTTTTIDPRAGDARAGRPASYSPSTAVLGTASTMDPEPELLAPSAVLLMSEGDGQSVTDTDAG